ncbi:MAG: caspase family protein [Spirochaetales bacterium]|nr:caspase family protein [Spirochaetales bacterium]
MRKLILLLLSLILILSSCELFMDEPEMGDVYAIMVGLDYKNNSQDDLKGTLNDVDELHIVFGKIAEISNSDYFGYTFKQEGIAYTSVVNHSIGTTMVNAYPSIENIEQAIKALVNQTDDNDLIIFTYSGHGKDDGTIALGATSYSDTALSPVQEILDYFVDFDIKGRKLIILDTCFSGLSLPDDPGSSNTVLGSSIDDWYAKYWDKTSYDLPDLFVLTASGPTESYEDNFIDDHWHGLFTAGLLKALGWGHPHPNPDTLQIPPAVKGSVLTVDSLYGYILDFIEEHPDFNPQWNILKLNEKTQHPLVSGGAMDMVLFRF